MANQVDTETLLVLLASLLDIPIPSEAILLGALADSNGDVDKAAHFLNRGKEPDSIIGKKRKQSENLDAWYGSKRKQLTSDKHLKETRIENKKRNTREKVEPELVPELVLDDSDVEEVAFVGTSSGKPRSKKPLSTSKPVKSLMDILKQAPVETKKPMQLPPLTLGTPELVSKHTPCTIHYSILPPELACQLFYAMLRGAADWQRNKWWLFDRVVESPHRTSFFARATDGYSDAIDWQEAAQFWYNGRPTPPPTQFYPEMEAACRIIEDVVNREIQKRPRLDLEWPADDQRPWRANVAASNCYTGAKEGVGFHSDQLTYLGPNPTIASLSLGTTRTFRLREVLPETEKAERSAQTFNMDLPHNSLCIMHASCQEKFKHTIPVQTKIDAFKPAYPLDMFYPDAVDETIPSPLTSRINITFRFYRPDFRPKSIPRCKCNVPTILRPAMKRRIRRTEVSEQGEVLDVDVTNYFWMCYAGAQNDGKGCGFYKDLDMKGEGRGAEQYQGSQGA